MKTLDFSIGAVNEGWPDDFFKKFKKNSLGWFTSLIPGMTKGDDKDGFAKAQEEYSKKLLEERKKEIDAKVAHKTNMRITAYKIAKEKELGELKAKNAIEAEKRRIEEAAQAEVLKRLQAENKKIDGWTGGPLTAQVMQYRMNCLNQIYKDATPAEQQLKDNWVGAVYNACFDEDGKPLDDDKVEENLKGLKDNPIFKSPELQAQLRNVETMKKDNPQGLLNHLGKMSGMPQFATKDEIEQDKKYLEALKDTVTAQQTTIDEANSRKKELEKTNETIKKNKEDLSKALEKYGEMAKYMSKDAEEQKIKSRKYLENLLKDPNISKIYKPAVEGKPDELDPEYKELHDKLKALGFSEKDMQDARTQSIASIYDNKKPEDKDAMNGKVTSYIQNEAKKAQQTIDKFDVPYTKNDKGDVQYDVKKFNENMDAKIKANNEKIDTEENTISTVQGEIDKTMGNNADMIRRTLDKPDDGTAVTVKDLTAATDKVDHRLEEREKSLNNLAEMGKKYKATEKQHDAEKNMEDTISKNQDLQDAISKQVPGNDKGGKSLLTKKDDDGKEYITYKADDGKWHKAYKPTDDKDPDYDEQMKAYNQALTGAQASMKIGPKPELGEDPSDEEILAYKQWELNRKNRDAAREKWKDEEYAKIRNDEYDEGILKEKPDGSEGDADPDIEDVEDDENAGMEEDDGFSEDDAKGDDMNDSSRTNPAKLWKRRKNKNTGKTTKNYYYRGNKSGLKDTSISPEEYKEKMRSYKERVAKKKHPQQQGVQGSQDKQDKQDKSGTQGSQGTEESLMRSVWTMTPLFRSHRQ